MRVGLDFDNTIARYDQAFAAAAVRRGWVDESRTQSKARVKAAVLSLEDGERRWMALQGEVYGRGIHEAQPFDGVGEFLRACRSDGTFEIFVVSHKTQFGHFDEQQVDLRQAAWSWMDRRGLFEEGIDRGNVFFEESRQDKVRRLAHLRCTIVVDDLLEVLTHPELPTDLHRWWFRHGQQGSAPSGVREFRRWSELTEALFAGKPQR